MSIMGAVLWCPAGGVAVTAVHPSGISCHDEVKIRNQIPRIPVVLRRIGRRFTQCATGRLVVNTGVDHARRR